MTKYSGADATLGLAFTHTGWLYPFFAPLLGWLGVALTGSDTSSNALFGSLQKITAEQLNLPPVLIVGSNSTGGVMGKIIDAQSIVVAAVATEQTGGEGAILRFVFPHSVRWPAWWAFTLTQAYFCPWMIPAGPYELEPRGTWRPAFYSPARGLFTVAATRSSTRLATSWPVTRQCLPARHGIDFNQIQLSVAARQHVDAGQWRADRRRRPPGQICERRIGCKRLGRGAAADIGAPVVRVAPSHGRELVRR